MFRVKPTYLEPLSKGGPKKEPEYLRFIHTLPCCLSGVASIEAAHLSMQDLDYGHLGRAKGRKASDRWVLPLSPALHQHQHRIGERRFWLEEHKKNPHILCLTLWGLWTDMRDASHPFALEAINRWRMT